MPSGAALRGQLGVLRGDPLHGGSHRREQLVARRYERLFGKPRHSFPHEVEAVWQVTDHAWVYVVADAERAGRALITNLVDDLDGQVAQLTERGVPVGPIEVMPGPAREAEIFDPEGNKIAFGQPPA